MNELHPKAELLLRAAWHACELAWVRARIDLILLSANRQMECEVQGSGKDAEEWYKPLGKTTPEQKPGKKKGDKDHAGE